MEIERREEGAIRSAMKAGPDCPPADELFSLADGSVALESRARLEAHVSHCARCMSEIALFREFQAGKPAETEERDVRWIVRQLGPRLAPGPSQSMAEASRPTIWQRLFSVGPARLVPAAALAVLLITVGTVVLRKPQAPELPTTLGDRPLLRGARIEITAPAGDLDSVPQALQWQPVPGAARYEVEVKEVDGAVLWSASTAGVELEIPEAVRSRLGPGRPFVWQVRAIESRGHLLGESGAVRFRTSPRR